jgi:MFS family permease
MSASEAAAYRANIWKFCLFRWLVNFQLWLPIWVIYLTDARDLSLKAVTALDAAFWILIVAMEVPTGAIADRWGRKVSLSYGALANAIAILVFGVADNYPLILASYLAWGVAWTLFSGADAAFFYDSLKAVGREAHYQKLYGRCYAIQQSGVLAGILLGAPLAAWTNLPTPILLSGGLMGAAWAVSLTFKEPPRHLEGPQLGYLAGAREAARIVLHTPSIRYVMLLASVTVALAMCVGILSQPFLEHHGVGVGNFGWFMVPTSILGMAVSLGAYRMTAAFGTNRVIAALPVVVLATSAGLAAWDSLYAYAFYPVNGVVWSFSFPIITDYLNRRIPSGQRATILSVYQLLYSLVLAPLEPIFGAVADEGGLQAAYRVSAILVAVAAAPLLALWLRAVRREPGHIEVPAPSLATGGGGS